MGAVPVSLQPTILSNILASITNNSNHLTVGEIALPSLVRQLHALGADDAIYDMVTNPTSPSYAYQVLNGATSLTERWDGPTASCSGCNSLNHFMLGYIDLWLVQLSGVAQAEGSSLWDTIMYEPILAKNLTAVSSTYHSPRGIAAASWGLGSAGNRTALWYNITVPVGAKGTVKVPFRQVVEKGREIRARRDGVLEVGETNGKTTVLVGSGKYCFLAS